MRIVVKVFSLKAGPFYLKVKDKKVIKSKNVVCGINFTKTIQAFIARCVIRSVIQNGCGAW